MSSWLALGERGFGFAFPDAGLGVADDREVCLVPREGDLYNATRLVLRDFFEIEVATLLRAAAFLEADLEDSGASSPLD